MTSATTMWGRTCSQQWASSMPCCNAVGFVLAAVVASWRRSVVPSFTCFWLLCFSKPFLFCLCSAPLPIPALLLPRTSGLLYMTTLVQVQRNLQKIPFPTIGGRKCAVRARWQLPCCTNKYLSLGMCGCTCLVGAGAAQRLHDGAAPSHAVAAFSDVCIQDAYPDGPLWTWKQQTHLALQQCAS